MEEFSRLCCTFFIRDCIISISARKWFSSQVGKSCPLYTVTDSWHSGIEVLSLLSWLQSFQSLLRQICLLCQVFSCYKTSRQGGWEEWTRLTDNRGNEEWKQLFIGTKEVSKLSKHVLLLCNFNSWWSQEWSVMRGFWYVWREVDYSDFIFHCDYGEICVSI